MARLSPCLVLALALLGAPAAPATAATGSPGGESSQALARFFQGTTRSLPAAAIDFSVVAGYAVLRTGDPDSSGRYAMTALNVARIAPDIYRLDISLEKPQPRDVRTFEQPYFYTDQRTYYFWYQNGERIVFKVGDQKAVVPLGRKDVLRVDIKSPDTYVIDRETMLKNISFDDGPVTIHLQLKFH
ncbi:MAG: hypothetical protein ACP59X_03350 [Solidesulfovibrio sp. DCME]|uniref:hypothetical protein n=1 Tax=Solidesulfovibrio sp. DCME TaxID=3447380 RepID=UPI003D12196D